MRPVQLAPYQRAHWKYHSIILHGRKNRATISARLYVTARVVIAILDLEAVPSHTSLILLNHRLAVLCRIIGLGEKHAVISRRLLSFADAARLYITGKSQLVTLRRFVFLSRTASYLWFLSLGWLGADCRCRRGWMQVKALVRAGLMEMRVYVVICVGLW